MAKKRRLRSVGITSNNNALRENIKSAEEVITKATKKQVSSERSKRIKYTTVISPYHRACLEFLAKQQKVSMADLLDIIIADYLIDNKTIEENRELLAAFEMIYKNKSK